MQISDIENVRGVRTRNVAAPNRFFAAYIDLKNISIAVEVFGST